MNFLKKIKKNSSEKKTLYRIYAILFVDFLAAGLIIPYLSTHLLALGASRLTLGLINIVYPAFQILSSPIIGSWADVRGRKFVMITTTMLSGIFYMLLGCTESLLLFFIFRLALGLFKHPQSICRAFLTDLLPPEKKAGAFGLAAAIGSTGFIIGPLLGGHVIDLDGGFSYICFLTTSAFIVNLALMSQLPSDDEKKTSVNIQNNNTTTLSERVNGEFRKIITDLTDINWTVHGYSFVLNFLFFFSIILYFGNHAIYLKEYFGLSQRYIGYSLSLSTTVGTISGFLYRQINGLLYKPDEHPLIKMNHFFSLMTVAFVGLYVSPSIQFYLIFLIPYGVSSMVVRVTSMELLMKQVDKKHSGSVSGATNSLTAVARFLTPITLGVTKTAFGDHSSWLVVALPSAIATIICYRLSKNKGSSKEIKNKNG